MGKKFEYIIEGKRPADATPEMALELVERGISQAEIARWWGISRSRVNQLVKKAKQNLSVS